jgi:hypothetical protein
MNLGWLAAVLAVAAVFTMIWRRRRGMLGPQAPGMSERTGGVIKQVEAYSFPVLGAALVIGALVFWETWISLGGIAIGLLFLVTGASSFREVRRRRAES